MTPTPPERTRPRPATERQRATVLQVLRLCGACAHFPKTSPAICPKPRGGRTGALALACPAWRHCDGVAPATRQEQLQGKRGPGLPEMAIARPAQVKAEGAVDALKSANKAACLKKRDGVRKSGLKH